MTFDATVIDSLQVPKEVEDSYVVSLCLLEVPLRFDVFKYNRLRDRHCALRSGKKPVRNLHLILGMTDLHFDKRPTYSITLLIHVHDTYLDFV